ncbi:peptidase M23 [Knoellia sinensis KCTC 19936]|uniref:Peptidase M23 n=1 Tax=Knoellia sinensis KCTC 19936 TaxID=1385520 RepID=A0A0A0J3X1_9MICO|nr:M23 family metallopeptidase [Knoellia sinensis]KGN31888.1 peptidase M23 [Knoellia sinensis KCTC 19936]
MSITISLQRTLLVLGVAGSIVPGLTGGPARAPAADSSTTGAAASAAPLVDVAALRRTWSWPLAPRPEVLAPFVAPRSTYGAGHRGLDVAARQGQEVRSVEGGVVTHVGVIAGRGTVSVTHESGLRSTYEPVRGLVSRGDVVTDGQRIGQVLGRSHCGGSCLHLGAIDGSRYVDPRPLLGGGPVILLPLLDE